MFRGISKIALAVMSTVAFVDVAHGQFGGIQLSVGGYGNGVRVGNYGYGNGYYNGFGNNYGNSYFGTPYYGNSYYNRPYFGNSYYGDYSNRYYNNGFGTNVIRNYGVRSFVPGVYATPFRSNTVRRFRYL